MSIADRTAFSATALLNLPTFGLDAFAIEIVPHSPAAVERRETTARFTPVALAVRLVVEARNRASEWAAP